MVTAINCIEKTPVIMSADDSGVLKLWDIRTFKCIQTCDVGSKSVISKLLDMEGLGRMCFISSRINFLEFDGSFQSNENKQMTEEMYPLKVEFNYLSDELLVCTRRDLRFIDLEKGRIKKIYQGLLRNNDDDITIFKSVEQNKKFVIGDHRGGLNMFNFSNGEKCHTLCGHNNEISVLKVDFTNKLFVSAGYDSNILIQKENNEKFEIKRDIKNCFHGKEIHLMELSVYHNILVMGSNNRDIYIWDYEYCKFLGLLELEEGCEPTSFAFINGFSIFLMGASDNKIYIIQIHRKEQTTDFQLLAIINLEENDEIANNNQKKIQNYQANKLLIDISFNLNSESPSECLLYLSLLKGIVRIYNILPLFEKYNPTIIPNANKRMNYNAYRGVKEDFDSALKKIKANRYNLSDQKVHEFNFQPKHSFLAHKDSLTTLILINLAEKSLLTSSLDQYIKIWNLNGEKIAAININHPLPIQWNIVLDRVKRTRKNILFALKIVELIFKRYKRSILLSEEKMININNFLGFLAMDLVKTKDKKNPQISLPSLKNPQKILLMKDEYSPRDLQFEGIKHIYQRELMGPSLREMENNKRLIFAQKFWKNKREDEEYGLSVYDKAKLEEKIHKENDPLSFFDNDFRGNLCRKLNEEEYSDEVQLLSKKMEMQLKKRRFNITESNDLKKPNSVQNIEKNIKKVNLSKPIIQELSTNKIFNSKKNPVKLSQNFYKPAPLKISLFDYASKKNILLETTHNSTDTFSLTTYSKPKNVEEKEQFHFIMRNIDKKLRTSQFNFTRNALLVTNESSFAKTYEKGFIKKKTLKKIPYDNHTNTRGSIQTNDTLDDAEMKIDEMIAEIRNKVKDNVEKKLMIELERKKKKNEVELKYQMKKIGSVKDGVEQGKEQQERGFIGLGSVFNRIDW